MWLILILFVSLVNAHHDHCEPLHNVTCPGFNSTLDPGLTGNVAFPVMQDLRLFKTAKDIVDFASTVWDPTGLYFTPTDPKSLHISIYYFPCVSVNYTVPVHKALKTFEWDSFPVQITSTCCGNEVIGWSLLMCVDNEAESNIRNFSRRLQAHLNQVIGPNTIPDMEYTQPWRHVTIGYFLPNVLVQNMTDAPQPSLTIQLDTFYFGKELYFARDFIKPGGFSNLIFLIIPAVLILIIVCLIPAVRLAIFTSFGCVHVLFAIEEKLCLSCRNEKNVNLNSL